MKCGYYYIWGAGYSAQVLLFAIEKIFKIDNNNSLICKGLIDNNNTLWGREVLGLPVISPADAYLNKEIPIIISLDSKAELLIKKELLNEGYLYGHNILTASAFLFNLMTASTSNFKGEDKEKLYANFLKGVFAYRHSKNDRYYMFAHIISKYLCVLIDNRSELGIIIPYAKEITWITVKCSKTCNHFLSHANMFQMSSMGAAALHQWNKNAELLASIFPHFNESCFLNIKYLLLDDENAIVIEDDELYFVKNILSAEYLMYFSDLTKEENKSSLEYVINYIKRKLAQKIYDEFSISEFIDISSVKRIHELTPYSEKYEYLMAKMYYKQYNFLSAQEYVEKGLKKRPFNEKLCELQGDIFAHEKKYLLAIKYYSRTMLKNSTSSYLWMILKNGQLNADEIIEKKILSCIKKYSEDDSDRIEECTNVLSQELLVTRTKFKGERILYENGKFRLGYNPNYKDPRFSKYKTIEGVREDGTLESFKAKAYKRYIFDTDMETYIIPIMRKSKSTINVRYKGISISYFDNQMDNIEINRTIPRFPQNVWVPIKVSEKIIITSEDEFYVGELIKLSNKDLRPKIIVNLFIDALAYYRIADDMDKYMPFTKDFFSKGVIFKNCYAVGEWTQTTYPSMFTGIDPCQLECFQARAQYPAPSNSKSIPEHLEHLGYFNTLITAVPTERFVIMGPERGYNHTIEKTNMDFDCGIRDLIDMLHYYETPQFINIHVQDVHDSHFNMGIHATRNIQTAHLDFDTVMVSDSYVGSQNNNIDEAYQEREKTYLKIIKQTDFKLRVLYEYLEKKYTDEEMLVCLHSDHGSFGGTFPLSLEHTNIAMMFRGKGVNRIGICDELLSGIDIYSIYSHLCGYSGSISHYVTSNLPQVFSGCVREYAVTYWRYPGQQYRVSINTDRVEFLFESKGLLTQDGRIASDSYRYEIVNKKQDEYGISSLDYFLSIINEVLNKIYEYDM